MKTIESVATDTANGSGQSFAELAVLNENAPFVEGLYQQYLANPGAVDEGWQEYFAHLANGGVSVQLGEVGEDRASEREVERLARVLQLIDAYRERGHLQATLDPLGIMPKRSHPELEASYYGFTNDDLDKEFRIARLFGMPALTLRGILSTLREAYCGTVGVEYMHMQDPEQRRWVQERIEDKRKHIVLTGDAKHTILTKLYAAEAFEAFLHTKFVGHKRFSLEGAEAMIPLVDEMIEQAAMQGVEEIVIGMAHRGRLNMVVNILGKSYEKIFSEFEGNVDPSSIDRKSVV